MGDHANVYLNTCYVGEPYVDYPFKVDYSVVLTNREKNISKQIVDSDGNIRDFPGVEYTPELQAELGKQVIRPVVACQANFEQLDDGSFLMIWMVRHDGRWEMDSWGFGGEDYEALELYSILDETGHFTGPFKLYSIGYRTFFDGKK